MGRSGAELPSVHGVTAEDWAETRARWLGLFADHVYGRTPDVAWTETVREIGEGVPVDGGGGIRRLFEITVSDGVDERRLNVLVVLPVRGLSPVVAALNFYGNHTVLADSGVPAPAGWTYAPAQVAAMEGRPMDAAHAAATDAWPTPSLLAAGWGLATVYAGDIEPDSPAHAPDGIRGLAHDAPRSPWGTIGAWAWGLSCVRRMLAGLPEVDADRIVAVGHSRMGKAALWAAAQDEGFAGVVSNGSGCGGAALTRHLSGEGIADITGRFPHWFTPAFAGYAGHEEQLPVDQHQLLAAIAPRALYVASATEDAWADPVGEYLATSAATAVHQVFGGPRVGYHLRPGPHRLGSEDWEHVLVFLRRHVAG